MYGESGSPDGSLQEGEAQLMMGRMLHTLQVEMCALIIADYFRLEECFLIAACHVIE